MSLTAGIVGMPNVGKSTLFNAITQSQVEAANYPFATIQPNVGVVEVPDIRVDRLSEIFKPKKTIHTTIEFTDIAGLVKGASKGEGLGNQFLSHIRETDAIVHVVRCFDDSTIIHVEDSVDPLRDIEIINLELVLADLQTIENRIAKVERKALTKGKEADAEYRVLKKIYTALMAGRSARSVELDKEETILIKGFNFLSGKPVIYVANMSEEDISHPEDNHYYQIVKKFAESEHNDVIAISAKIEEELAMLEPADKKEFMNDLGIHESGLDSIIKATYHLLGLCTYLTAGTDEVRAWTFKRGMKAPECAGIIHTDFQKGFIRAETYSYIDFIGLGSEQAVKDHGKMRSEGKEYLVQDGDVMNFRFNV